MCRPDEYPPFDTEAVGALSAAAALEDVLYDPHEDHADTPDVTGCMKCQTLAERDAAERFWG